MNDELHITFEHEGEQYRISMTEFAKIATSPEFREFISNEIDMEILKELESFNNE